MTSTGQPDPPLIHDHAFEPRGAWFTLCLHCGLGEAAHTSTTGPWYTRYTDRVPCPPPQGQVPAADGPTDHL